ncbi:AAA family ATPase [Patescibacteria group bacterium]|nr:AAA family ATPase [Patescibacteria group bacterium]
MHLEKLEIQGFKSFANKNTLVFPGFISKDKRGLTAVVGPNGSGKSNIADAVRWALGEQSTKTLRGKKSEDVIFSGSDKKGQLGMAEVSLFLNNEDNNNIEDDPESFLQYKTIVITRKLFRSGESQYLINNQRVRLSDVQMLLAKANFGQKTYSVIGQGIVENFLNTSPAERKDFFDEATGVKKYQIKRDLALNKLINSYDNLEQANLLLSEIEPRLKSLTRQVEKLKKRSELEEELKNLQYKYYSLLWQELNSSLNSTNKQVLEQETIERTKNNDLNKINTKLSELEKNNQESEEKIEIKNKISQNQSSVQEYNRKLAQIEAKLEINLEAQGKFDLSWLYQKETELKNKVDDINKEILNLETKLNQKSEEETTNPEINKLDEKIKDLNKQILKFSQKQPELKTLIQDFANKFTSLDINNSNLKEEVKKLQIEFNEKIKPSINEKSESQEQENEIQKIQTEIENLGNEKAEILQNEQNKKLEKFKLQELFNNKRQEKKNIENELQDIINKLSKQKNAEKTDNSKELEQEKQQLLTALNEHKQKEESLDAELSALDNKEKEQRQELFNLQKTAQRIQQEINNINIKLNDLRVQAARKETRLEDLENEIRKNELSLGKIKDFKVDYELNREKTYNKIESNKRQLEQIGGIDPETEQEYNNTKERFDFLSKQSNDLSDSIKSLEKIINELDQTIKKQFDKEFKIIEENFKKYFIQLFNGGKASLNKLSSLNEKEDKNNQEENKAETETEKIKFLKKHNTTGLSGIEIQACPPGKKIKSISMLSGGERALTAIALICAIISANPAPFVVLDEVDAALDEANSERLANILDELSHKTQFIVVTHNRASMRKASLLYGITMSDDGVSHLLSVKLEDIKTQSDIKNLNRKK